MILPYKHHVTNLVIEQHHTDLGHMGQESVLSSLRERFWVVKGRSAVRKVIKKCMDCKKRKAPLGEQFMADLSQDRVTPHKPPFTYVGIDYFGPLEVKQGRSRVKRYGCLFTCLTMRAVHIEVAHTLNTDSMINASRRFSSVRGCPEEIRSDCGTNFMKADKDLKKSISEWNQQKIQTFCTQRGIRWNFNPPGASHMGGIWERMIRSVRQILKALLKEQVVVDEVLTTVMAETSNILNSRPLTRNSDDPSDDEPLTPNHLLQLRAPSCLPPGIFSEDDQSCRCSWRQAQYLSDMFWKRWTKEYLPLLQARQKWNRPTRNFQEGDLVLLADEKLPRRQWPMGRVQEVYPSQDGLVRSVQVKTTTSVLKRPVSKLCRLEMDN